MSYNPLTQAEDANSDSDCAEIRASPLSPTHRTPFSAMPPNLDLHSIPSETWTRPRTVSRDGSGPMECPTPDLQSIQGAYVNNIERLEQSAERMSLSSDIGEEIRKMREEQKKSDSRRSSIQNRQLEDPDRAALHRQLSYTYGSHASSSIVGTNSVARSGGFSPAAYFASPRGSVRSSTRDSLKNRSASQEPRLEQVTEPVQEGKPLDSPLSTRFAPVFSPTEEAIRPLRIANDGGYHLDDVVIPRTESSEPEFGEHEPMMASEELELRHSTDTARQANGLFSDFDGVHTVARPSDLLPADTPQDPPLTNFAQGQRPQTYLDSHSGDNMVYYPAPVPMMLNLPKRLSKLPNSHSRDQRRSQLFGNPPNETRKSAAWLPDTPEIPNEDLEPLEEDALPLIRANRRTMANIPPQLRATMFFDSPGVRHDVEVKGASAVATLDSILDASASAPVTAFTDHPIVGQVGGDVYSRAPIKARPIGQMSESGRRISKGNDLISRGNMLEDAKKRNSLMSIATYLGRRKSSGTLLEDHIESQIRPSEHGDDGEKLNGPSIEHQDETQEACFDAEPQQDDSPAEDAEIGPADEQPTTLLAELQMRKERQKLRNRTAATAFPDGMHSTLLQLDAVAQVQQQSRKQKHTILAWEDPDGPAEPGNEDDEDIPLGMLYSEQKKRNQQDDDNRPLGLIARRQMEDSEPLSHRRARLRGEPPPLRNDSLVQQYSYQRQAFPKSPRESQQEVEDEDEDHGSETLAQRIKRMKKTQIPPHPRPVSTDFSSEILSQFQPQQPLPAPAKNPDLEAETLGQRRKRLQAEAAAGSRNASGDSDRNVSNGAQTKGPNLAQRRSMADILQAHPAIKGGLPLVSDEVKYTPAPRTRNTSWAMEMNRQASQSRLNVADGGSGYAPHPMVAGRDNEQTGDDRKKGDMINRWRQSVMY
ncbi:uncharacterized protein KY384_004291 [Bacidia gigantensis]|uniref:uncharacterized protein n=1 Tax=Bacidia gigantensis TaxID=2732470 RepID=UPI001D052955|nr:uncharacterized protein KY384_004291 [Bacidia gigantensis]KAG8530934.1 hypothetical protein KY384_004291 [Bacidia gigantensis]